MLPKILLFMPLVFAASQVDAAEGCLRATRAMATGEVPVADGFVAADCTGRRSAPSVRYDAGMRAVRLVRPLQPGDRVDDIAQSMMVGIAPGQSLYVSVQIGPVVVQRQVEALQPANPGQKLFVRGADGKVMRALYSGGGQ